MWSVGCIFGELLGGKVMFKGRDCKYAERTVRGEENNFLIMILITNFRVFIDIDQLQKIFDVLGTPEDLILGSLCSQRVRKRSHGCKL